MFGAVVTCGRECVTTNDTNGKGSGSEQDDLISQGCCLTAVQTTDLKICPGRNIRTQGCGCRRYEDVRQLLSDAPVINIRGGRHVRRAAVQ